MKRFLALCCLVLSFLPFSNIHNVYAVGEDCNKFGGHCYVDNVAVYHSDEEPSSGLLDTIKRAINRVLGILASIALVICMYAGFKMLTSGGDSKSYSAGWTILKNASIGLAIIALSWMIVSAIFWFVGAASDGNSTGGSSGQTEVNGKM